MHIQIYNNDDKYVMLHTYIIYMTVTDAANTVKDDF